MDGRACGSWADATRASSVWGTGSRGGRVTALLAAVVLALAASAGVAGGVGGVSAGDRVSWDA